MGQVIQMTTRTQCDQPTLDQLAAVMVQTRSDIEQGTHDICITLIDQPIRTVARCIIKFEELYNAGKDRQTATDAAIAAARAGEL